MLKPGDKFERYTIEGVLGQGGMGVVYRAHDTRLERRVALKLISDGLVAEEATERLLREARAAASIDHPNAVAIFDLGVLDGAPFIVMELVSGGTLRARMTDTNVSMSTKTAWLADIAKALSAAHARGLVHRDVKPENVMVRDDGGVKVLDFGIARRQTGGVDPTGPTASSAPALPTLTQAGMRMGTPLYMAPEQIRGIGVDGRADQFAWGVVAFELLTGKLPWRGGDDALAIAASVLTDEVDRSALTKAGVPDHVAEAILRALEKRPEDRFATMEDAAAALSGVSPSKAETRTTPPRAKAEASPGSTTMARFSTQEMREVLARAVDRQEERRPDVKLGFEDLVDAAREVGVDEEVLREIARERRLPRARGELAPPNDPSSIDVDGYTDARAWLRKKRRSFFRHLGMYIIVNAALLAFGLVIGHYSWVTFCMLGWGIGIAADALTTFTASEDDFEQERAKRRRKRARHKVMEEAVRKIHEGVKGVRSEEITAAVEHLLETGRKRIQAIEQPRIRIEDETAAAEHEAEAIAEGGRKNVRET